MGFFVTPPRPTVEAVIEGIDLFSTRAEIATIHEEVPWRDLLAGQSADAILDRDKVELVAYLRSKGLKLYFMADATDGLARESEAPQLRALGRSLSEPAVQQAYRDYVLAVNRKLAPQYLGVAAETNLVRAAAPASLYQAVVEVANAAAADLRAVGSTTAVMASVQVETAWGRLDGSRVYQGIERDRQDFAFAQVLGLSSYPYFGFASPQELPADYYSRLLDGRTPRTMVVEGGWTSSSPGSPSMQADYMPVHAALLDSVRAEAVVQTLFADIDLASLPGPVPPNLPFFTHLGLVDSNLAAKPALAAWDALRARALVSS